MRHASASEHCRCLGGRHVIGGPRRGGHSCRSCTRRPCFSRRRPRSPASRQSQPHASLGPLRSARSLRRVAGAQAVRTRPGGNRIVRPRESAGGLTRARDLFPAHSHRRPASSLRTASLSSPERAQRCKDCPHRGSCRHVRAGVLECMASRSPTATRMHLRWKCPGCHRLISGSLTEHAFTTTHAQSADAGEGKPAPRRTGTKEPPARRRASTKRGR